MNTQQVSQRGGAQIGWLSASWPLANIRIEHGKMTLNAMGKYTFATADVQAIEPVGSIPFIGTGIRVHHTKNDYPNKVVFYSVGRRDSLLQAARTAGFTVGGPAVNTHRGFPVRFSAIVVFILVWNALFLLDRGGNLLNASAGLGVYSWLAMLLAFVFATCTLKSAQLQKLVLRDGHHVGEISGFLRLLQIITGIATFVTGLTLFLR
jgi:hypothetical protein